ncbi:DUF1746-domain-containing protein [Byssothecium circinans]|uniref:DUF1746-domain-containing protein n=1 Tax=Byssothecium circinans TaxID=147558 RepID=A0A6A5TE25_9PLEO|nr:DUF1746-domain-containing protein [Byssothecium circinans]
MNDEAESSRAGRRHEPDTEYDGHDGHDDAIDEIDEDEDETQRELRKKERRMDAKRKRLAFLDNLLRELDTLVFIELITLYHLDCSFFWFTIRSIIHGSLLTPLPDMGLNRQHDEHKPFLPMILFTFLINFLLHLLHPAPAAGEDTREYLHGGLMIDFIGQKGPTSKWKLAGLDIALLLLQMTMLTVHVKKRELKKNLAKMTAGSEGTNNEGTETTTPASEEAAAREQDADAEERGVLRRTDTLSDIGNDSDEENALLPPSEAGHTDALDLLTSGQCVIGEFTLIDTLLQAHVDYNAYRQMQREAGTSSSVPSSTLRQLHAIRARIGVGGG